MMKCLLVLAVVVLAMACPWAAESAYIVYSDGGAHSLNSASTNYYGITMGSTFNVLSSASITPLAEAQFGDSAIFSSSSNLNIYGGTITGGASLVPTAYAGSVGVYATGSTGSTTISGGQITGGTGSSGGTGLVLNGAGPTMISGGSITGGKSALVEGQGGIGVLHQGGAPLSITGGTFSGGATTGPVPIPSASLYDGGNGSVEVSGGQFLSEIVLVYQNFNSRIDFFGTGLNYANGILSGTLNDGSTINQVVSLSNQSSVIIGVEVNSTNTEVSFVAMAPAVVPEPCSITLIVLGLGGVGLIARPRKKMTRG